jgi:hypothetical protein
MKNKGYLIIITLLGILSIATYFFCILNPKSENGEVLLKIATVSTELVAYFMLFQNSTIKSTFYWRLIMFCFSILIIGSLFKIQHGLTAT